MKVLIVKTSSMGDLIHTLPAVTDAVKAIPGIRFDWVAEDIFSEIPAWHRAVDRVVSISFRRWRKSILSKTTMCAILQSKRALRENHYEAVIDAQGLIKSGLITRIARGERYGMDSASCKEGVASLFYQHRQAVQRDLHAIDRVRLLFAKTLVYEYDADQLDYGLDKSHFEVNEYLQPYIVFFHASSANRKLWVNSQWIMLADLLGRLGFTVLLPWGNDIEHKRAHELAANAGNMQVLPEMDLNSLASVIAHAAGTVGVDTGLSHLAAALSVPGVTLYTATAPGLTGTRGKNQLCVVTSNSKNPETVVSSGSGNLKLLHAESLTAEIVLNALQSQMSTS